MEATILISFPNPDPRLTTFPAETESLNIQGVVVRKITHHAGVGKIGGPYIEMKLAHSLETNKALIGELKTFFEQRYGHMPKIVLSTGFEQAG